MVRCKDKEEGFLVGRSLFCEVNQEAVDILNVHCCYDHDLCNDMHVPTLAPDPSLKRTAIGTLRFVLCRVLGQCDKCAVK